MNLKEIIDALLEHAKYDTPERYEVRARDEDGNWYRITRVDDDEDGIFIKIEEV